MAPCKQVKTAEATILLVEDEAVIALMEERILRSRGFDVVRVLSGEAAIAKIEGNSRINLVLMDIDLGSGMDGTETSQRILKIREVPIVFLTSHGEREMVEKVKGITRYGYVLKNSGEFVLTEAITMALELFKAHTDIRRRNERLRAVNRENEERRRYLEALFKHTPDAMVTLDRSHRVVEWNPGARSLFGYSACEASGQLIDDLVAPKDTAVAGEARALTASVLDNPRELLVEAVRYTKQREPLDVIISGAPITIEGECIGLVVTYKNITRQKRSEDLMRRNAERYRLLAENSLDVILYLDPQLRPLYVSPSATKITGHETRYHYSHTLPELAVAEDRQAVSRHVAQALETRVETSKLTYRICHREGRAITVESVFKYLRNDDDSLAGILVSQRDCTERVRAEERIKRQTDRAEELATERELLLHEIYHRVKNDMNLVRSLLSLQASRTENEEARRHIEEAGHRVSVITRVYQRLTESTDVGSVNLRTFLPEVLAELSRGPWSADVRTESAERDIWVSSRVSTAVGIVVNELTTNATKYGTRSSNAPDRPKVTISVAERENGCIVIRIMDDGPGFPPDVIRGTRRGLGLTIVEALATQYGGSFSLTNDPQSCAEVTICPDADV